MWICVYMDSEDRDMRMISKDESFNVVHGDMKSDFDECYSHQFDEDFDEETAEYNGYGDIGKMYAWISGDECDFDWQMFEV